MSATEISQIPRFMGKTLVDSLECNPITEDFAKYKNLVANTTKANIDLLKELPPFKTIPNDELVSFFKSKIKRDLENDKIFEKGIEIHNYAQTMLESMDKYFKNIFDFHKSLKYEQTRNLLEASKLFLNSDLPESTLKVLGDSYLAETDFLDFYDGRIRKEKLSLIACRGNRLKFEKTCAAHNKWVHNFDVKVDQIERERVKLFWYVDISNSSNVKEIFQDKFISIQRLEKKFLNELIIKLEKTISELQELVFAGIGVSCFPSTKLDAGVKTMASLMNILSQ